MRAARGRLLIAMVVVGVTARAARTQPDDATAAADDGAPADDACTAEGEAVRAARAHDDPLLDEALYDAAACHQRHGAADEAIALLAELRTRLPRSRLAARALFDTGAIEAARAHHADAAAAFEAYATRHPTERDAPDALADALRYRLALGDDARALADGDRYARTFGRTRPADAARLTFALAAVHERRGKDALLAHLRAYVKAYGARGGDDRLVLAFSRIGELLWTQSCKAPTVDGTCLTLARARTTQCGPAARRAITIVARDDRRVREAMAAFAAAITIYERRAGRFPDGDEAVARHAYAVALFHRAEVAYEAYLALALPAGLDFDPARPAIARTSTARFTTWLQEKQRAGATASAAYERLITDVKDPAQSIAAAARLGQLALHLADALYTAEVPRSLRGDRAAVDAYCDALTSAVAPLEQRALDGLGACVARSRDLGWWSAWSAMCERELTRLDPERFPAARELHAPPELTAPPPSPPLVDAP